MGNYHARFYEGLGRGDTPSLLSTGNNSQFTFDGFGQMTRIIENVADSAVSTKQFVWLDNEMREARNSAGSMIEQYFAYGQTLSATSYYCTCDILGSVREISDSSGTIQSQYSYDPFGQKTSLQGAVNAVLQFTGHYYHAVSGLYLTRTRALNPKTGRWFTRDPIKEAAGVNLYAYAENDSVNQYDPFGMLVHSGNWCAGGWANGGHTSEADPNLPRDSRWKNFRAPTSPLDYCCWLHDLCLHWARGLDDKVRRPQACWCDHQLAKCSLKAGNIRTPIYGILFGVVVPHRILPFVSEPGIGPGGTFPPFGDPPHFPLQNPLLDPFDPGNGNGANGTNGD